MSNLLQIILECVDRQLDQMPSSDGSMPSGHNGPYHDPETPVRNTGHWLITFSRVFDWTGDEKYRVAAKRCAEYLFSKAARPHGYSFHHRNGHKDHCNGLMGQAWTFEALAEATRLFNDPKYARLAEEVFFQHPFDEEVGLWNRLEIDGRILPFDSAFNHQLWFAACAAMLQTDRYGEILRRVNRFLDHLDNNLTILPNGLLYHPIEHLFEDQFVEQFFLCNRIKRQLRDVLCALKHFQVPKSLESETMIRDRFRANQIYKSIGYHAFNMYAFALLKPHIKDHSFWSSERFMQMMIYIRTDDFRKGLEDNKYGYPYNPPGFEVVYSHYILADISKNELINLTSQWVNEQFCRCCNPITGTMDRNTEDPTTHTARLYELTRMPRGIIEAVEIDLEL